MEDAKTFERVYLKYYPQLVVYGRTICSQEELIEDTIQELFLVLWQKNRRLIFTSSIESYLFASFRNNLVRKLKQYQALGFDYHFTADSNTESEIQYAKEKRLHLLLQKLPARQREVLFLRYYKNQSYQEIAENLDISYQVARNFAYRGIKWLKSKMKDFHFTEMLLLLLSYSA